MTSFQISISPSRRAAARFITGVRRAIQKALVEEKRKTGLRQTDIARSVGVHRSVINREIRGYKDLTLGRVAELAHALGRVPSFELLEENMPDGANAHTAFTEIKTSQSTTQSTAHPRVLVSQSAA
jgi:plasmid maintenance system antidote protein VapI